MRSSVVVVGAMCLAGALVTLLSAGTTGIDHRAETAGVSLPAALADFYPPKSQGPTYLLAMYGMSNSLSGMVCDVLENDMENARLSFERFKKTYEESRAMIPEWTSDYPMEPVERFAAMMDSGDVPEIMAAAEAVGGVCHNCHVTRMAAVQQKYRWGDFSNITVSDPLSGQEVGFAKLMLMMQTNFSAIDNNIEQGQYENALKQFAGFSARFQAMSEACGQCHDSERRYYVSDDITARISDLQAALSKPQIDAGAVRGILQSIGSESCSKCHLVHVPAAYAQQTMTSR